MGNDGWDEGAENGALIGAGAGEYGAGAGGALNGAWAGGALNAVGADGALNGAWAGGALNAAPNGFGPETLDPGG